MGGKESLEYQWHCSALINRELFTWLQNRDGWLLEHELVRRAQNSPDKST